MRSPRKMVLVLTEREATALERRVEQAIAEQADDLNAMRGLRRRIARAEMLGETVARKAAIEAAAS